jgi:polar amino acid transport system substrate-binding protein
MRRLAILLLTLALGASAVHGQEPIIPVELRAPNSIRLDGSNLTFCITTGGPIEDFERAVAEAIAGALLLEPVFVEVSGDFPMYEETDLMTAVYQLLNERCEAFIGFNLVADTYPTWLALSRAYASVPFSFVVVDERYSSLADLPRDRPIGTPIVSAAESAYIAYAAAVPVNQRWQRFPYGTSELMLRRLLDGTIEGAFFWEPSLKAAIDAVGEGADRIRRISSDPVRVPPAQMGFAVLANQDFLLKALDEAIASLGADGTLQAIMDEFGILGQAVP